MNTKYYLSIANGPEQEVTQEQFIEAERDAGFYPKPGCGPIAIDEFESGIITGRVEYRDSDEQ